MLRLTGSCRGLASDVGGGAADPEWKQRRDREERRAGVDVTDKLTGKTQVKEIAVPGAGKQLARRVDVDVPQEYAELDDEGQPDSKEVVNAVKRVHQRVANQLGIALNQVLEVSTAGMDELGQKLSAFNLKMNIGGKDYSVESLYQGSKVFDDGKAMHDLYEAEPGKAKGDPRVKGKRAKSFDFFGQKFEADDQHSFYNWLYTNALTQQHPDAGKDLTKYKAFTDLYSGKGGAMQSEAVAMASTLAKQGRLTPEFVARPENLGAVLRDPDKKDGPKEPSALEGKVFAKIFPGMENLSADIQAILRETPLFKNALQDARESIEQWARIKANPKQLRSIMELLHGSKLKDKSFKVLSESPGRLSPGPLADTAREFRKVMTDARERGIGISTLQRELIEKSGRGGGFDRGDSDVEQRDPTRKPVMSFGGKRSQDEGALVEAIRRLIAERFVDKRPHSEPYPVQMKNIMEGGKFRKLVGKRDTAESLLGVLHPDLDEKRRMEYADVGKAGEMVDLTKDENADIRRQIEQEERDRLKKSKDRANRMVAEARGREGEKGLAPALRYQEKVQKLIDEFDDESKRVDQMHRVLRARKLKQGARSGRTAQYNQRLAEVRKEVEGSDVYKDVAGKFKLPPQLRAVKEYVQKTVEFVRGIAPDLSGFKLDTRGRTDLLQEPGIAVIGNRAPPPGARTKGERNFAYGVAERIGERLAQQGVNVVSGLAAGVDTAAHRGALKAGGTTTMVPATGLGKDVLSKQVNSILLPLLSKGQHLFASMFKKDAPWSGKRAMDRNELVRALSDAVVAVGVSEKKGGSYQMGLDTIRQGKPLYVVSPDDLPGRQEGGRDLIAKGGQEVSLKALRDQGVGIFRGEADDRRWRGSQRDAETGQLGLFDKEPDPLKREDSVRDYYQQIRKEVDRRIGDKVKNIAKGVTDAVATQLEIPFGKAEARVKQTVKAVKAPTKSDPGGQMMLFDQPAAVGPAAADVKHIKSIRKDLEGIREVGGLRRALGEVDLSDSQQVLKVLRQMEMLLGKMGLGKTGAQGSGKVVSMLGSDFDEAQREVRNLHRHVDTLQTLFKDTSGDTGYLDKKIQDLDNSFSQLDSVADRLISSVRELDARLGTKKSLIPTTAELKDNVEALSGSLMKLGRDADKSGDQIEGELEDPLQRVIRTLNQLRGMEGVKADSPAIRGMPRQIDRLRENMGDLTTTQAGLNKLMESGESDADVLRQSYSAMDSSVESLRANIRSLGSSLEYVENSTDDTTKDTDEYKQAVAEAKGQLSVYDNELNDVEEQLKQVRTATDEVTESIEKKTAATKKDTESTKKAAGAKPKKQGRTPTQTGRGIRQGTPGDDDFLFPRRTRSKQEGDAAPRKTRQVGEGQAPDFRNIGFVDLFASMEIFERIFHRMQMVVEITSEFGFQMARVGGITGTTVVELDKLTSFARKMGETTIFSATESAAAMEELAKVGYSASNIISTLPTVLNVAAAEGMKLAQAAEILAANLKAFEMEGTAAERMGNTLAAASMRTAATMEDFGVGLRTVATFAHSANVSVEETVALLGKLADAGLTPRRASVALRALLQQMQRLERSGAYRKLNRMGLTMADIDPKVVGLTTAIARLDEKIKETGADADDIFTVRASHAFQILSQVGQDSMRSLTTAITGTNAAADLAARQMDTFQGSLQRGRSVFEEFQISLGTGFEPIIRFFLDVASVGMKFVINMDDGLKHLVGMLTLFGATALSAGQAWAVLEYSGGLVADQFKAVTVHVKSLIGGLKGLLVAHPYIAAMAAIGIAIGGVVAWVRKRNAEEEKAARLRRERLREEIRLREDLVSKLEQRGGKREDSFFTAVQQEQMVEAAERVGTLKIEFDSLGAVIHDSYNHLLKLLEVMRKGDLRFPALKKFEESVKMAGQTFLNTAEMVQIVEFMEGMRGFQIDIGDGVFTSLTVEFNKLNEAIFKTTDGIQLTAKQTERVLEGMRRYNELGESTLARSNITEGVLNRITIMDNLAKSLSQPFAQADPLAGPGNEAVGRSFDEFIEQIKSVVFAGSDQAQAEGRRTTVEIGAQAGLERIQFVAEGLSRELRGLVNEQIRLAKEWGVAFDRNKVIQLIDALVSEQAALERGQLLRDIAMGEIEPRVPDVARGLDIGVPFTAGDVVGSMKARSSMLESYKRMEGYELPPEFAKVLEVIDGDTLKVSIDGQEREIRVKGIDTRESRRGDKPEPFSKEATVFLRSLIGDTVQVSKYRGERTFGRDVMSVQNLAGQDVSEAMVAEGLARVTEFPADDRMKLLRIQEDAMAEGLNIWGEGQERFWTPAEKHYMKVIESQVSSAENLADASESLAKEAKQTVVRAETRARVLGHSVSSPSSPTMPQGLDDFAFDKAGHMGALAKPMLDRARRIQSQGWFRNKHASRDLNFLITDLGYYLEALALIMEGKDSPAFLGDMDPGDLKKEIKQIEAAIRRKIVEIDTFQKKEYAKAFRDRLEFLTDQIGSADAGLLRHIQQQLGNMEGVFDADDDKELLELFEDNDTIKGLRRSLQASQKQAKERRDSLIETGIKRGVEAWIYTLDELMLGVAGKDAAGLLDMADILAGHLEDIESQRAFKPDIQQRFGTAEELEKLRGAVGTHLNKLFSELDSQLSVGLGEATPIDIRGRMAPLVDLYDMLGRFTDALDADEILEFQKRVSASITKLTSAEISAYTRELEDVGFAGLEQRIQSVDWLQSGIEKLRGRLGGIPETIWNGMMADILPQIEAARETLTGDLVTKLGEGVKVRLEADPTMTMDEALEPYLDLIKLLDPKELAEFLKSVGANVDEYQRKLENLRVADFSEAIKAFGEGLDRFNDLLPGVAHRLIDEEMAKLTNRVMNEARRRVAASGGTLSLGLVLSELQAEAAVAFNALARKQAAIDMKEYTGRLWESIATVGRGGFVGMIDQDRPSQVVEQSRRDMGVGDHLQVRGVPEVLDIESLPRVEFAKDLKGSVDGAVEKLTTGVERVVESVTLPLLDVTQTLAGGHNLLEGFKHRFVRDGQIQTDLIKTEAERLNMTYLEFLSAFAAPLAQISKELGKKQEELEKGVDELGVFDKLMSIGPTETGGKSFEERHGSPFEEPFFRTPSQYEGHYLKQEESRIERAKAQVKIDFAGSEDLIDYETGKLDKELQEIKDFRGQQGNIRDVMGLLQERFEKSDLGGTTVFGGKLGAIFEDLLNIEAHLDLTEHLHKLGDTAKDVSDALTSFIQRMDQTSSIVNLFGNFMKDAGPRTQILVSSLASGVAALAAGEGGEGAAVGILGGVAGGVAGAFLGDPLTGATLGSSLFSSLYGAFFDKAEAEAEAVDSLGNADPGIAGKVDVRNTTIHIGSIVHDNMFSVTETVDPQRIAEELAGYTEADLREIVV